MATGRQHRAHPVVWLLVIILGAHPLAWVAEPGWAVPAQRASQRPTVPATKPRGCTVCAAAKSLEASRLLQGRIRNTSAPQEVFEIITFHGSDFDEIHAATCLRQLATMNDKLTQEMVDSRTFRDLIFFLDYKVGVMDAFSVSNTMWALGELNMTWTIDVSELIQSLIDHAAGTISNFGAFELRTLVRALAQLRRRDSALMEVVARKACKDVNGLDARSLTNLATGFADLGIFDEELMEALAKQTIRRISEFSLRGMGSLVSSFTRLNGTHERLSRTMMQTLAERSWQDQSTNAWFERARVLLAASRAGVLEESFLRRIAQSCNPKVLRGSSFYTTAAMLWACRKLGCECNHPELVHMLEDHASHFGITWADIDRPELLDALEWNRWFGKEFARRRGTRPPSITAVDPLVD